MRLGVIEHRTRTWTYGPSATSIVTRSGDSGDGRECASPRRRGAGPCGSRGTILVKNVEGAFSRLQSTHVLTYIRLNRGGLATGTYTVFVSEAEQQPAE